MYLSCTIEIIRYNRHTMEREKGYTKEVKKSLVFGTKALFVPPYKLYKANEEMIKRRGKDFFDTRLREK